VSIPALGNAIYRALCRNPQAIAAIRKEYEALALSLATNPDATAQVTSATVNGQTFSSRPTMTNGQRLQLLSWVIKCVENGATISTTQITRF